MRTLVPGQLWIADMPARRFGFEYGARMTVLRLPNGTLWIHSPVALTPDLRRDLDDLGPVAVILAPSRFHRLHVAEFAAAYPEAEVHAVPAAAEKLGKAPGKAPGKAKVKVSSLLGDDPARAWADVLEQSQIRGSSLYDEVDFYHGASRTLILTDLCFNIPVTAPLATRVTAGALGILGRLSVSTTLRFSTRDRAAVRHSLERVLAWDFDRLILSHGDIVETDARPALERALQPFLARIR
jgi:hypothetical protein